VTTFATGAYLWLLADDDILTNFALQYTLDLIEKTEFDLMVCNAQFGPKINKNIP
jgi:hypothetical protein